jgi:predicted DNA binding CopG/RHH family protein
MESKLKVGRKPVPNREIVRSRIFQLRMTESELLTIRQNASKIGMSVSDYVRLCCLVKKVLE